MTKHVLVTGGAGFIGSHLVDAYLERGCRVSVIDDLSTGDRRNLSAAARLYEADLRDPATMTLLDELRPDLINHHAAQMDVRYSVANPAADAEANIIASLRLLQKATECGVKRFIFASSGGAVYGEPQFAPQTEEHPVAPMSPYGCAKLAVEHYLEYYRVVHKLPSAALRYANVYGPRQSAKGEAGVIAIFARRLLAGESVTINGNGEQTRDFVYVGDVVAANMAVSEGEMQGVYNVGTGVETTINELYDMMALALGVSEQAAHAPAKTGEQLRSVVDGSRLAAHAGLPRPMGLRDGLPRTIEFFRGYSPAAS